MKECKNLSFLKLLDSGHMAPLDQPEVCLDMMMTFMYGRFFQSSVQSLNVAMGEPDPSCPSCPQCDATTPTLDDRTNVEVDSLMKAIVEHSWLAAVLAVLFLLVFFCTTMRSSTTRRTDVTNTTPNSGLVEMMTNYRDDTDDYHDDDDDDGQGRMENNGDHNRIRLIQ